MLYRLSRPGASKSIFIITNIKLEKKKKTSCQEMKHQFKGYFCEVRSIYSKSFYIHYSFSKWVSLKCLVCLLVSNKTKPNTLNEPTVRSDYTIAILTVVFKSTFILPHFYYRYLNDVIPWKPHGVRCSSPILQEFSEPLDDPTWCVISWSFLIID